MSNYTSSVSGEKIWKKCPACGHENFEGKMLYTKGQPTGHCWVCFKCGTEFGHSPYKPS